MQTNRYTTTQTTDSQPTPTPSVHGAHLFLFLQPGPLPRCSLRFDASPLLRFGARLLQPLLLQLCRSAREDGVRAAGEGGT